jgi:tetratricopeptide (TPR) repeat protein
VFRRPLRAEDIQKLVPKKEALNKLMGYSLIQLEGEKRGFVVHPVVSEYVLDKIGKEECKRLHKKAVEFYIHQHDDLLKKVPKDIKAEPLELLCGMMELLTQRGMRKQAEAMTSSLLEIHHHLFQAEEYEKAGGIVTAIWHFLDMQGLCEIAKELLKKSIDSLEGPNKYVAMGNLASLLKDEGKWQEALKTYQQCLEFFKKMHAKSQMAVSISQQALIYQQRGKYKQALKLEQKSLALEKKIGNKEGIVISHYRMSQLLRVMESYNEALKKGKEGLKLARKLENQQLESAFHHHLGLTLNELNRPKEAFEHFNKSLAIKEQIGNKAGQADSLSEIGKLLFSSKQFKGVLDCFQQALEMDRQIGNPIKVSFDLEAIGVIFEEQGHYEEALIKYREALQLMKQYSAPPEYIAVTEENIARVEKLLLKEKKSKNQG